MLFVARKDGPLLRIKNSTILMTFGRLKWIKPLTNFCWTETNLCQNWIWNSQDSFIAFVYFERRETGNLKDLYRNELDKVSFAHDALYSDSKDLAKRTISDMIQNDSTYEIARNRKYDEYQRALARLV